MISASDLELAVEALKRRAETHAENADSVRRTDPGEAHEDDDLATACEQAAERLELAAQCAIAYESQLAIAAAERDSEACHQCGARPLYDEHLKLCASCSPVAE